MHSSISTSFEAYDRDANGGQSPTANETIVEPNESKREGVKRNFFFENVFCNAVIPSIHCGFFLGR